MSAYQDYINNGKRLGLLREKYGVGYTRMRQLVERGRRLSTDTHHWTYGLLTDEELRDLDHIKDWIDFLSKSVGDTYGDA